MSTSPHPYLLLQEAVEQCRREMTLASFLDCVDLAADLDIGDKVLPDVWQELSGRVLGSLDATTQIDTLGLWLAKHSFGPEDVFRWSILGAFPGTSDEEYKQKRRELEDGADSLAPSITPTSTNELANALLESQRSLVALKVEDTSRTLDSENPYAAFRPAWEIQEFLHEHFSREDVDDPGAVIGKYLRLFFPAVTPVEPEIHWYPNEELRSIERAWIHDLLATVCRSLCIFLQSVKGIGSLNLADSAAGFGVMSEELSALAKCRPPRIADKEDAIRKLKAICRSPQALLSALCRIQYWISYKHESALLSQMLSSMPWGRHHATPDSAWGGAHAIFGNAFDRTKISSIPWAVVDAIERSAAITLLDAENEVIEGLARLLRTWLAATHRLHNGQSPVCPQGLPLSDVLYHYQFSPVEERVVIKVGNAVRSSNPFEDKGWSEFTNEFGNDLWLLLCMAQTSHFDYLSLGGYKNMTCPDFEIDIFLSNRPLLYMQIIDAAHAAGYVELANAFLAFGIFSQALTGYSIAGWPKRKLGKLLVRSRGAPGGQMVRRAISVASSVKSPHEYALHQVWLSSYGTEPFKREVLPRPVGQTRKEIERACQGHIGEECWLWLYPATKSFLVDAELIYSRCHMDMGVDGFINFGGLAANYCKAFEAELMVRFQNVFPSIEYDVYKTKHRLPHRPALGNAVFLIENFLKLPGELKARMRESRLLLHEDAELVEWMLILKRTRNAAAHPKDVSGAEFLAVREISMKVYRRMKTKMG